MVALLGRKISTTSRVSLNLERKADLHNTDIDTASSKEDDC